MRLSRSGLFRAFKISAACLLIGLALWALFLPPMFPASSRALINARTVTLDSLDMGIVQNLLIRERQVVEKGAPLLRVGRNLRSILRDQREVTVQLEKLDARRIDFESRRVLSEQALHSAQGQLKELGANTLMLTKQRLEYLTEMARIGEKSLSLQEEKIRKLSPLLEENIITSSQWSSEQEKLLEIQKSRQQAIQESSEVAQNMRRMESDGAESGTPVAKALQDDVRTQSALLREISAELKNLEIERRDLNLRMQDLDRYMKEDQSYTLDSPVNGIVWKTYILGGESIQAGDKLIQLADQDGIFVEVLIGRQFMESIAVGDHAHILILNKRRFIEGHVRNIQAQEEGRTVETAIQSVAPDASMLRLLIDLDPGQVGVDDVGQITKVMISSARPGPLKRGLIWLSFMLRNE